jgi:Rad3-related DNA helicase
MSAMRFSFLLALIFAIILSSTYWYRTTAAICPIPLPYQIGEIDPSFELSYDEVKEQVATAETEWEEAVSRELFLYDVNAEFTINFIFDERQEQSNQEERQRRFLDGQLEENEEVFAAIEFAQGQYDELAAAYEVRAETYETRLADYNQTVQRYNDRGGAPEAEFAALEVEREELNAEADALARLASELNDLANRINQLSDEANRLVDSYNANVADYNQSFGYSREFTQGDYQGDRINIYEFSTDNELQSVLMHEFGHALGIGHVVTQADLDAFYAVCGTGGEWDNQLRRIIRSALSIF